jgi:hypothetical protein
MADLVLGTLTYMTIITMNIRPHTFPLGLDILAPHTTTIITLFRTCKRSIPPSKRKDESNEETPPL